MTIDEMIAVLQAAKAGKQIEAKYRHAPEPGFVNCKEPSWDFYSYDYRIKPREGWVHPDNMFQSEPRKDYIKVREVL